MDGKPSTVARRLPVTSAETVIVSHAGSACQLAPAVARVFEQQGLAVQLDEKLRDVTALDAAMVRKLDAGQLLCVVRGRRCAEAAWTDIEATAAAARGIPLLVLVEDLSVPWRARVIPTLMTKDSDRLAAFVANSRPDGISLWEFGRKLFVDRSSAARFRRNADNSWRWRRVDEENSPGQELALEFAIVDDAKPPVSQIRLVEARVEGGLPVLLLGTTDGKRYRLAYSRDIRAVIPAPVYPDAPPIGFMHMDFDSGREWPRAGEPPIELRLLGRDVYGWHMSEYFWRAFVGSLPKMLGRVAVATPGKPE
ncbi:MAG: hypothetical protein KY410_09175 [Proteobacteria bacterium]|nr:hypothetical protein [Pseudomonadota bacterium]